MPGALSKTANQEAMRRGRAVSGAWLRLFEVRNVLHANRHVALSQ
jgi:hypothetical protein